MYGALDMPNARLRVPLTGPSLLQASDKRPVLDLSTIPEDVTLITDIDNADMTVTVTEDHDSRGDMSMTLDIDLPQKMLATGVEFSLDFTDPGTTLTTYAPGYWCFAELGVFDSSTSPLCLPAMSSHALSTSFPHNCRCRNASIFCAPDAILVLWKCKLLFDSFVCCCSAGGRLEWDDIHPGCGSACRPGL